MTRFIQIAILIGTMAINSPAAIPTATDEPSSQFIRQWLLCGPFPNPQEAYDKQDKNQSGFYRDF